MATTADGDARRDAEVLERGHLPLEGIPYSHNVENHFVVDLSKYDFYAMDCYRLEEAVTRG